MGRPEVRLSSPTPFADMFFDGGAIGVEIGHSGFMGSENLFLNCFWLGQTTAGLLTSNANALQQTVIGGDFQGCNRAIFAGAGSVPTIPRRRLPNLCRLRHLHWLAFRQRHERAGLPQRKPK